MTLSLDRLRELREWCRPLVNGHKRTVEQPAQSWEGLTAALDELIARREADRWKPASEPPDTDSPVLVKIGAPGTDEATITGARYDGRWWQVEGADNYLRTDYVKAWRELPEAT